MSAFILALALMFAMIVPAYAGDGDDQREDDDSQGGIVIVCPPGGCIQ